MAAALDTPIASGETEYTRYGFRRMLELKSADVLMPDLQRVGGVTEFVRVAHMADAFDVPVSSSHLFPEMSIQVLAALGNATWLEHMPLVRAPLRRVARAVRRRDHGADRSRLGPTSRPGRNRLVFAREV